MMEKAGDAIVKAYHADDLLAARKVFRLTPKRFRLDLRDYANWLLDQEEATAH